MRLLVTGAGGILGSAFARWSVSTPEDLGVAVEIHAFARVSLDIADPMRVAAALDRLRPEVVVNAAAFTNVDAAEKEIWACRRANVEGPKVLAEACRDRGIRLLHVSTDYVFDGEQTRPYTETDATNPKGIYAQSKREGEQVVLETHPSGGSVVRTAWIYGTSGKQDFVEWVVKGLRAGQRVRVITDQWGSPTWSEDLVRALVFLGRQAPGLYHVANAGVCTRAEQAQQIAQTLGLEANFEFVTAAMLGRPAPRPSYTALDSGKIAGIGHAMRPWDVALTQYLRMARA